MSRFSEQRRGWDLVAFTKTPLAKLKKKRRAKNKVAKSSRRANR